jgi:transcriptional regulator with GAF, ATPase, and Fis domain
VRARGGAQLPAVLILGETGSGKGFLARLLHRMSPRGAGPLVDVNCAGLPEGLLESELFGHERGAFTGAAAARAGLFQAAHRGTLFLDEIGLLGPALQAKLLKAVEERAVRRLGSDRAEAVDTWIVSATNEDLGAAVRQRRFREDLYHRLAVVTLVLPPLRERGEDAVRLARHFLARAVADYRLEPLALSAAAEAVIRAHRWPGNVRQLANAVAPEGIVGAVGQAEGKAVAIDQNRFPPASEVSTRGEEIVNAEIFTKCWAPELVDLRLYEAWISIPEMGEPGSFGRLLPVGVEGLVYVGTSVNLAQREFDTHFSPRGTGFSTVRRSFGAILRIEPAP